MGADAECWPVCQGDVVFVFDEGVGPDAELRYPRTLRSRSVGNLRDRRPLKSNTPQKPGCHDPTLVARNAT